jgi:hypothetical protein
LVCVHGYFHFHFVWKLQQCRLFIYRRRKFVISAFPLPCFRILEQCQRNVSFLHQKKGRGAPAPYRCMGTGVP